MDKQDEQRCWFHKFGGGVPCPNEGRWTWADPPDTPGRAVLKAMRWCDEHRHDTDRLTPVESRET